MITHTQIITLQQINGCGNKSILTIGNYIQRNRLDIRTNQELLNLIETMKSEKLLKRFPNLCLEDLEEAEMYANRIIEVSDSDYDIHTLSFWDELYPDILRETIDESGKPNPPILLYYKGDLSCLQSTGLAIIGTREITEDGVKAGLYLAKGFAERGLCIVSGLAVGCDTCGHKGALAAGGQTIAFLAHGLDTIYPEENKQLAEDIVAKGGLLLSEYPIGTRVNRYNLVARDRLQAGLAKATLVIQTGIKGGTMHAAQTTIVAEKPLFTVWFNAEQTRNHPKVQGNCYLVTKGAKYIKGNADLDQVTEWIKQYQKPQTTLF